MTVRIVVLIGPPGSGKSHLGRALERDHEWNFEDSERMLVERYASRDEVFAKKDEVLMLLEARYRARLASTDAPVVLESTGLSDGEILRHLSSEFRTAFVRVWADVDTCVERVRQRPAGGNINNDPGFTRNFHAFWERDVASTFQYALRLDTAALTEAEAVQQVAVLVTEKAT